MQLSIITPVYNSEPYLDYCVNSILNQTFHDFELILVDDGSSDRSGFLCDEYALKDSRIKVIHQTNQGQAAARNVALDIAQGEYIGFVDSDDYIHPQMMDILLTNAKQHAASISVACSKTVSVRSLYPPVDYVDTKSYIGSDFFRRSLLNDTGTKPWILCNKIFHRDCFQSLRLPAGRIYEDNSVVYKLLYEAHKVVDCDVVLYYYFQTQESTMRKAFSVKNLDWLKVLEEMIPYFEEKQDAILVDKLNRSYLFSLTDLYQKVRKYLDDPVALAELKAKLNAQYRHEKQRYPITIKTHPNVVEILRPGYAKCYWTVRGILARFKK